MNDSFVSCDNLLEWFFCFALLHYYFSVLYFYFIPFEGNLDIRLRIFFKARGQTRTLVVS